MPSSPPSLERIACAVASGMRKVVEVGGGSIRRTGGGMPAAWVICDSVRARDSGITCLRCEPATATRKRRGPAIRVHNPRARAVSMCAYWIGRPGCPAARFVASRRKSAKLNAGDLTPSTVARSGPRGAVSTAETRSRSVFGAHAVSLTEDHGAETADIFWS